MRILLLFFIFFISQSNSFLRAQASDNFAKNQEHILFVVSNAHYYGDSQIDAANHFAEIVWAYDEFIKNRYQVDFVSPKGGAVSIGYIETSDTLQKSYLYNHNFMNQLKFTKKPSNIVFENYEAIYYVGGGAAMYGIAENKEIQKIAINIYEKNNGIIAAICHGTAGITDLKTKDGEYFVKEKVVNGFPDKFENMDAAYYKEFPFSIQQKINENGGLFKYSEEGWDGYYEVDGRLITGQDPTSAAKVAQEVMKVIESTKTKSQ